MSKKKMVFVTSLILIVVVISLGIVKLYQTYALGNYMDASSGATYNIFTLEDTSIKVPANSSSNVFYMVNNTSPGTVRYGVGYTTDTNISVKIFNTSIDPANGLIDENGKKYVKLRLENSSSTEKTIELSTVLGYSGDNDLIVPTGVTLVTEVFSTKGNFATYIKNLYEDANKTTVTNNSITYNYATSESLMNDRLGDSTTAINGGNIRYYGASPNNYVYFNCNSYPKTNCERWRVIGVFDGKVKLMRNEEIGTYPWDNKNASTGAEADEGSNNWNTARIMKLLNSSDYYTIDTNDNGNGQSLYYNAQSGNCFSGTDNDTASCNFTSTGLKTTTTRNMISTVTYPLGGTDSSYIYADQMYKSERNPGNVYGSNSSNWVGKVALPYASDYGYAVDFNQCDKKLSNYGNSTCVNNNWMSAVMDSDSWLLTHNYDSSSIILYVSGGGIMDDDGSASYFDINILPSLYLNSKVELVDGTGTYNDPYQLSDSLVLETEVVSSYTVSYNANGGSGAPSTQTKLQNETLALSSTTPTRTGYQFMGWNTSADGSGTSYQASANYYDNSSVTLYAQWKKNITVTYNANGGSGAPSAQTKLSGESLTLSSTIPTRTGYTFNGWNTSSSGNGTSYTSGGTYSADDSVTLYAQWSINYYDLTLSKGTGVSTIYYKVNGASSYSSTTNSSIKLSVKYGTTYYYYGVASTGYAMSSCTSSSPCSGTMGTSAVTKTLATTTNSYNLTITKGTGVSTIYYKVNGASTWTSSSNNVTLALNYNTSYSYYGVASTGYTMSSCTSSSPCSGTMGTSAVTKTLAATINSYNLTIAKGTGVSTIYYKVNGASTWTSSSNNVTLTLNYNTSYSYYGVSSGEYTMNSCTSSSPCSGTMGASARTVTLSAKDSVPPNISVDLYSGDNSLSYTSNNNVIDYSSWLNKQVTIVFTASDGGSGVNTSITEYYGKSNSGYPSSSSLSSSSNTLSSNNTYTKNITGEGYNHVGIKICDNSSNCSTFYVKFKLDTSAPSASLSAYYTDGSGNISFTSSGNTFRNNTWLNKLITLELTPSDNLSGVKSTTTFSWNLELIPSTTTDTSVIKTIDSSETLTLSNGKFARSINSPGQRYVTFNLCDAAGNCVTKEGYFNLDIYTPTLTYEGSSSSDSNTKLFACSSLSGTEEFRSSDSAGGTTTPNSGNYYTHWWSSNSNQLYVTCESNAKNQSRYELVKSSSSGYCGYTTMETKYANGSSASNPCATSERVCGGTQLKKSDCKLVNGNVQWKEWYWVNGTTTESYNYVSSCIGCVD